MERLRLTRDWAAREASKCMYCGFCEAACPTLHHGPHRGYGPRGRVTIARIALETRRLGGEGLASIYTCLLCAACVQRCPAGIDIPRLVRAVRALIVADEVEAPHRAPIRAR
jgi:Fe-S oxidoreductase